MKRTFISFLIKCFFFAAVLLSQLGCTSSEWRYQVAENEVPIPIYVVSHGWHTGIVIPSEYVEQHLSYLTADFPVNPYYEFGWGDKGFYQAKEITSGLTVQAIFWPTPSVMHVVSLPKHPVSYFPNSQVVQLDVSKQGMDNLLNFIDHTFSKSPEQWPIKTKAGLYGDSEFYQSDDKYFMTNTCNTWVANALYKSGAPFRTWLTLTSDSVMSQATEARISQSKNP